MFSSRTARGLFTDSKAIPMNHSCLALVLKSKPRLNRGDTWMVLRGYFRFQSLSTLSMVQLYSAGVLYSKTMCDRPTVRTHAHPQKDEAKPPNFWGINYFIF